jgi:long-chain fatty acid transport protein
VLFPGQNPVEAAKSIARLLPEGRFRLAGTSNSPGFNLGYFYKNPHSKTSFGASWRSAVVHHLRGQASFAFTPNGAVSPFLPDTSKIAALFPNQAATGLLTTPNIFNLGVAKETGHDMTVAFDFSFQDFSRFKSLPINFTDTSGTATPPERRIDFNFRNSFQTHLGAEKHLSSTLIFRAGFIFDHSPVSDQAVGPLFPDSSRVSFTLGATQKRSSGDFTFFYQGMKFLDRTTNVAANVNEFTNGLYHSYAHLAGLAWRVHMGKNSGGGN